MKEVYPEDCRYKLGCSGPVLTEQRSFENCSEAQRIEIKLYKLYVGINNKETGMESRPLN
jgi:hypothetical protein